MLNFQLRGYQQRCSDAVIDSWKRGNQSALVVMPTGSGKTEVFIDITRRELAEAGEDDAVLILSHLSLLTTQTTERIEQRTGIKAGVLQAEKQPPDNARVIISTMQSASDFFKVMTWIQNSKKRVIRIIIDECHREFSNSYDSIKETFPHAKRLSVTASPFVNGMLMSGMYDDVPFTISMQQLIDERWLVPLNLHPIKFDRTDIEVIGGTMLKLYLKKHKEQKGIIFVRTQDDAKKVAEAFTNKGVKAIAVTDKVTGAARDKAFSEFEHGDVDILVSCDVLTAGFDSRKCSVIFSVNTDSPVVFIQRGGRAMRTQDGTQRNHSHWKQSADFYIFGDAPTIKASEYEKMLSHALNPRKIEDCKTVSEQIDALELNGLLDHKDFETVKAAHKIVKIAEKLKMKLLSAYVENRELPDRFLNALIKTGALDNFKRMTHGTQWLTPKQENFLRSQGLGGQLIDPLKQGVKMTKNEASVLIDAIIKSKGGNTSKTKWTMPEGRFKGKPIWEVPHAARTAIIKYYPRSANAELIRKFEESRKK